MSSILHKFIACTIALAVGFVAAPVLAQDDGEGEGAEKEEKIDPYAELQRANKLASYNAWTRSIPHYKKVIEAAPRQFPIAHFNLAEVYRVKEECKPAVLYFEAYLRVGNDQGAIRDAKKAIKTCKRGKKTAKLDVKATPADVTTIKIGGAIFAEDGTLEGLELLPGEYEIELSAADHIPSSKTVELDEGEERTVSVELIHKTYFGTMKVNVDKDGATVTVEPLELDAPDSPETPDDIDFELDSPMEKARKLPTGKYSVLVEKKDYDRWIRYVRVERDQETTVNVELTRSLPEEIR
jgi:hypothetical protein